MRNAAVMQVTSGTAPNHIVSRMQVEMHVGMSQWPALCAGWRNTGAGTAAEDENGTSETELKGTVIARIVERALGMAAIVHVLARLAKLDQLEAHHLHQIDAKFGMGTQKFIEHIRLDIA